MDSEDGALYVKSLAHYVRTHEKALASATSQTRRQPARRESLPASAHLNSPVVSHQSSSSTGTLASALSIASLSFSTQQVRPSKLHLTPHHLYYLLTRFEDLNIPVGPMSVRLENIHSESSPANYVSFLRDSSTRARRRNRSSDSLSIHSVSSVRSVMSGVSSLWSSFGFGSSASAKVERQKLALEADLKYLYSSFTKIPCLKLAPDRRRKLIEGYEEFPFDTAVPLLVFKNLSALDISDIDIRQFFGWDQLAERLRSLTVKRGGIEDPAELIVAIVLDDMDKRRRRSAKTQPCASPIISYSSPSPVLAGEASSSSAPPSPTTSSSSAAEQLGKSAPVMHHPMSRAQSSSSRSSSKPRRPRSSSPSGRPTAAVNQSGSRSQSHRMRRSGSGSSHSSSASTVVAGPTIVQLPSTKWRFLRHLSLADNGLHTISQAAFVPLANSLHSLDLSGNVFTSIPDCLSVLTNLRALNLSNNMIDSLRSLTRSPLPAITALNLRGNRLSSIAGIERLLTLERLDLRENKLTDPTELARLTGAPNFAELWVAANPFTRTHSSSYRVTIFNLFRNTPGYTDDILLDSQAPGMIEKRSLVERAAEAPTVPVVKPPPTQTVVVTAVKPIDRKNEKIEKAHPAMEVAKTKRKVGRRRVVELSQDDVEPQGLSVNTLVGSPTSDSPLSPTSLPPKVVQVNSESLPPNYQALVADNVDWSLRGDEYRRKVEALKNEVGSGWLSVLSEEGLSLPPPNATATPTPAGR